MSKAIITFPSGGGINGIDVLENNASIISDATSFDFAGAVNVTDNGSDEAGIEILPNFTEANSGVQNTSSITAKGSGTNINAAIIAKGNGATTAKIPDGTTAGGNSRGNFATDFQKEINNANQVASGNNSVIAGGKHNLASGQESTVGGGLNNQNTALGATIPGGRNNSATNTDSFASGSGNTASGLNAFVHGRGATASGTDSVAMGERAVASGARSYAFGSIAQATADNSVAFMVAKSDQRGFRAHTARQRSAGAVNGDRQIEDGIAIGQLQATAAGQTFLAELAAGVNYTISGSAGIYIVEISYILQNRTSGGGFSGNDVFLGKQILYVKSNGAALTLGTPTSLYAFSDAIMAGSAFTIGSSGVAMTFTFTSPTATLAGGNALEGTVMIKSLRTF